MIRELDGVAWCLTHDDLWHEGDTICNRARFNPDDDDCDEAPLYVEEPS